MKLLHGDCLEILPTLEANSIDAIVTDPPYGLSFMGKHWDHGIPGVDFWKEHLRVAKPGAHLLAFGGTRTYHRLICAIEDAGWEIRDCLMWVYGSGFPKSLDVSKAIDKEKGAKREIVGQRYAGRKNGGNNFDDDNYQWTGNVDVTIAASEEAQYYEGWGTALKPAWEPIILARKPISEKTVAQNVLKWGTGALNIDECRIEGPSYIRKGLRDDMRGGNFVNPTEQKRILIGDGVQHSHPKGRWPANLIHDGSEEVVKNFPQSKSRGMRGTGGMFSNISNAPCGPQYGDSGSAARFFYCAKTSPSERGEGNIHPTVKPLALLRYLCKLITPQKGIILDAFMGSGSTGLAAKHEGFDFIGIEKEEQYFQIAQKRINSMKEETTLESFFS